MSPEEKVAFISGRAGSTVVEVELWLIRASFVLCFTQHIVSACALRRLWKQAVVLSVAVVFVLLWPEIDSPHHVTLGILIRLFGLVTMYRGAESSADRWLDNFSVAPVVGRSRIRRLPIVVTQYRGITTLLTCGAILAVDFTIFPRSHGKTETVGFSLMDIGSGTAVFSAGFCSRIARYRALPEPITSWRNSAALVALGFMRLIAVKSTGYPEHVTEYGVHWNFFWTLAFVTALGPLLASAVHTKTMKTFTHSNKFKDTHFSTKLVATMVASAVIVALLHQVALMAGLGTWIMLPSLRDNLLSANREGLVSLPGYISLYLAGTAAGVHFFSATDGRHRRRAVAVMTALAWCADAATVGVPSRVAANVWYNLAVVRVNATVLLIIYCCNMHWASMATGFGWPAHEYSLLDVVSRAQLGVFLVANMMTGAVNLFLDTLSVDHVTAVATLLAYMAVIGCSGAVFSTLN